MRNIIGTHVWGEDFSGREHELKRCKALVDDGNDILLLSPRRVGKTSLSAELGRLLMEEGWIYIRCDVQGAKSEREFLTYIKRAIMESKFEDDKLLKKAMANILKEVKKVEISAASVKVEKGDAQAGFDWHRTSIEIADIMEKLSRMTPRVLFVLDELPIFLRDLQAKEKGRERVAAVLDWLNFVRENITNRGVSWFWCGSIGLDSLVEQIGMPEKIQKFSLQQLGPMPRHEAEELLDKLCINPARYMDSRGKDWVGHLLGKIGWLIPSYIKIVYDAMQNIPLDERTESFPSADDVDRAYASVIGKHYTSEFSHWDARLSNAFVKRELSILAKHILDMVCQWSDGIEVEKLKASTLLDKPDLSSELFDEQFEQVLKLLENDGYLHINSGIVAFRSPLLRDYWNNKKLSR